jgi:hypothetical protein
MRSHLVKLIISLFGIFSKVIVQEQEQEKLVSEAVDFWVQKSLSGIIRNDFFSFQLLEPFEDNHHDLIDYCRNQFLLWNKKLRQEKKIQQQQQQQVREIKKRKRQQQQQKEKEQQNRQQPARLKKKKKENG